MDATLATFTKAALKRESEFAARHSSPDVVTPAEYHVAPPQLLSFTNVSFTPEFNYNPFMFNCGRFHYKEVKTGTFML